MKPFQLSVLVLAAACGGANLTTDAASIGARNATIDSVQVNGPLRFTLRDMPAAQATPPFGPPAISVRNGEIDVARQQFGSLCEYAVDGRAEVHGGSVGLHVRFVSRLTSCTADLRVLQYGAALSIAPGIYDVAVVHEINGVADTLARQSVTVP